MRIQIVSDLHVDCHRDWLTLLNTKVVLPDRPDTLIVAGDTAQTNSPQFLQAFRYLSQHYLNILVVLGNHEHYKSTREEVNAVLRSLPSKVKVLQEEKVTLNGFTFGGTSLWFGSGFSPRLKSWLADFKEIPGFEPWVYEANYRSRVFLDQPLDVWVTHHLPHYSSVAVKYIGSAVNCFFVDDCSKLIRTHAPLVCIHGHTHEHVDYEIEGSLKEKIRVLANPLGYPNEHSGFKYCELTLVPRH
jgi:Icc-related predicted phosphoesterase